MISRLAICIDMGVVNNGVYYIKYGSKILDKKAINFKIDKDKITFSKKTRRENRHRVRSYARRKLAKMFFANLFELEQYTKEQKELIFGLFNNRGFTFLSSEDEFNPINETTQDFIKEYLPNLKDLVEKEDFEELLSQFEDIKELEEFINGEIEKIEKFYKVNKNKLPKDYQEFHKELKTDLKNIRELFLDVLKELKNGAKPRKKYLKEIKDEIESFDFIDNKNEFYKLVGNISNLQLRILRKLINTKDKKEQFKKVKNYFLTFHYKTEDEKLRRRDLFRAINSANGDIELFLKNCNPIFTIPPYEDMNNRNSYKCNSLHLNIELHKAQKDVLKNILNSEYFAYLTKVFDEIVDGNEIKYLQRFLDVKLSGENREFHPRNVFKFKKADSIETFIKLFGKENYEKLKEIATLYYEEEEKIINGIYNEKKSIFKKCNLNTPYKNNIKEILLKPLYGYEFSKSQSEALIEKISDTKGLKSFMELISKKAKKYQNRFYFVLADCMADSKFIDDKDIKKIVKNLESKTNQLKMILDTLEVKGSFFDRVEKIDSSNLKRIINIFKQTYEILFKDIHGFNKTCKYCTVENNIRSSEENTVAKRLLSDVAKPIDGMLDMMLDRLAFEIVDKIESLEDIEEVEVFIEQNRFEFEEGLSNIKGKKSSKAILKEIDICPYTGEKIGKGEYDHILAQSKELFNSKANLIYASVKGNKEKSNKRYTLDNLNDTHLEKVFKTRDKEAIKQFIKKYLEKIDEDKFVNFESLPIKQQMAFRYALFLDENSQEFKKAKQLLLKDKIRTFTNGTQKRLIKLIYKKLYDKFGDIKLDAKVISSELVSATRTFLSINQETGEINHLFKEEKQDSHSHCIDAMVLFFLATAKLKGQQHRQREYVSQIEPKFKFDEIYLETSKEIKIKKTTIKEKIIQKKPLNSIGNTEVLFRENMLKNHYLNIFKKDGKFYFGESLKNKQEYNGFNDKILNYLIRNCFIEEYDNSSYKINHLKLYEFLFLNKKEVIKNRAIFKKLDELRYTTQKKSIVILINKFINPSSVDEKNFIKSLVGNNKITKLKDFNEENIYKFFAKGSKTEHKKVKLKIDNTWRKVAKILSKNKDIFLEETDKKLVLKNDKLVDVLKETYLFKITHVRKRKVKKEYSLPLKDTTDKPFLIRRKDIYGNKIYQVVFAKNSARGFVGEKYIHAGHKNIIPLKFEDYLKAFKNETSNS